MCLIVKKCKQMREMDSPKQGCCHSLKNKMREKKLKKVDGIEF